MEPMPSAKQRRKMLCLLEQEQLFSQRFLIYLLKSSRSEHSPLPRLEDIPLRKSSSASFLKGLPIYRNITIKDKSYFLTYSGYHADFEIIDPKTGMVDIQKSVDSAVSWDQEQYLFSDDIHYIPQKIKFDKRIIVGHYATLFLTEYGQANIYYGERYIDIDTGNERRNRGGRLACLRLNDGKEYYV